MCMALILFSETCGTAAYSHLHKKHMLWLHVTDECLEQFFVVDELVGRGSLSV